MKYSIQKTFDVIDTDPLLFCELNNDDLFTFRETYQLLHTRNKSVDWFYSRGIFQKVNPVSFVGYVDREKCASQHFENCIIYKVKFVEQ